MPITPMAFNPVNGWRDTDGYPTKAPDEAAARVNLQKNHDQARDYINLMKDWVVPYALTTWSTNNAYNITTSLGPTAYSLGMMVAIRIHASCYGSPAPTLSWNGLTAKPIITFNVRGFIYPVMLLAGHIYLLVYTENGWVIVAGEHDGGEENGWAPLPACTYSNPNAFTIPGMDWPARISKGDKVRLVQASTGNDYFFYVTSVGYSSPTLVNIMGGSDYLLDGTAITYAYVSKAENPDGFPHWFNWQPSPVGYSVLPTGCIYRFRLSGKTCELAMRESTNGTSSAAGTSYSLPIQAANPDANMRWSSPIAVVDNTVVLTTPGAGVVTAGATILACYKDVANGNFTATGGKRIAGALVRYEI